MNEDDIGCLAILLVCVTAIILFVIFVINPNIETSKNETLEDQIFRTRCAVMGGTPLIDTVEMGDICVKEFFGGRSE